MGFYNLSYCWNTVWIVYLLSFKKKSKLLLQFLFFFLRHPRVFHDRWWQSQKTAEVINLKVLLFSKCQRAAVACDEKEEFSFLCWAKHWRLWRTKKLECFVTILRGGKKRMANKVNSCRAHLEGWKKRRLRGADLMIIVWRSRVRRVRMGGACQLTGYAVRDLVMGRNQAFSEFSEWCWDTTGQVEGAQRPRV